MIGRLKVLVAGLFVLVATNSQAETPMNCVEQDLAELYATAWQGQYSAVSPEQASASLPLFSAALDWTESTSPTAIKALANEQHMQAIILCPQADAGPLLVIQELPGDSRGRGLFLFAPKHAEAAILQVPHARADAYTGSIGLSLLLRGKIAALALNTVPRRQQSEPQTQGYAPSDLAHTRYSYFQSMAEALARKRSKHALVQLHGFSKNNRRTLAGMQADIIVSSGRNIVSPYSRSVSACLEAQNQWQVELYPATIKELGATQNVTGQLYRRLGESGFLHLELAHPVRARLRNDNDGLAAVGNCL